MKRSRVQRLTRCAPELFVSTLLLAAPAFGQPTVESALTFPIEAHVDQLLAAWPTEAAGHEDVFDELKSLAKTLNDVYKGELETHHAFNFGNAATYQDADKLAKRGAKLVRPEATPTGWTTDGRPKEITPASRMPRFPEYFGVQCLTPIPERPHTWSDFIIVDRNKQRAHAARFDEQNVLQTFIVIESGSTAWRAIRCTFSPNGAPIELDCFDKRGANTCAARWDDHGRDTAADRGEANGTLSVAYSSPDSVATTTAYTLLPMPISAIVSLPDVKQVLPPPPMGTYEFVGWSGDAKGRFAALERDTPNTHIVAPYQWRSEHGGKKRFIDRAMEAAVRERLRQPAGILTSDSLAMIYQLDISQSSFDQSHSLHYLRGLRSLNVSETDLSSVYILSPHAAFESVLAMATWHESPGLLNKVLLALSAGAAPPLETLIINEVKLARSDELGYLLRLKKLEHRNSELRSLNFVQSLRELQTLDVSDNNITSLTPLAAAGDALSLLTARRNQITDISPLVDRANWPSTSRIVLSANPLSPESLCEAIPALTARGLVVTHDGACGMVAGEATAADSDGDGYSDQEEWAFVSLFSGLQAEREKQHAEAIQDPDIPRAYLARMPGATAGEKVPVDSIPTSEIYLEVKGQGTVYPGPGKHAFARIRVNPDRTWGNHRIELRPEPAFGWSLKPIHDSYGDLVTEAPGGNTLLISTESSFRLILEFEQAREKLNIDLVDALKTFVQTYYPQENPYTFDMNEIQLNSTTGNMPEPNGIPDAAEFRLLQMLLQSPDYDGRHHHGTSFDTAMETWKRNWAIAERALGTIAEDEPATLHTICAYATIADWAGRQAITAMMLQRKGIYIDAKLFKDGLWATLAPDETIHDRATFNSKIWEKVSEKRPFKSETFDAYATSVLAQPFKR